MGQIAENHWLTNQLEPLNAYVFLRELACNDLQFAHDLKNQRFYPIRDQRSKFALTVAGSPCGILATTITINPYMKWSSVFWKLKSFFFTLSSVFIFLLVVFVRKLPCKLPEFPWHFPSSLWSWYHPLFAWSNFAEFIHSMQRHTASQTLFSVGFYDLWTGLVEDQSKRAITRVLTEVERAASKPLFDPIKRSSAK